MTRGMAVLALAALSGCGRPAPTTPGAAPSDGGAVKVSESGPVKATVSLSPARPTLGDPLRLVLRVEAQAGVEVRMPAFGEALGRFSITSFTPRQATRPDGGSEASQEYVLDAPMSGKQKIPPLRVEFVDRRPGAPRPDGGAEGPSELFTDELTVDVASALAGEEQAGALRGPLGPLDESEGVGQRRRWPWVAGGGALLAALALGGWLLWRRRRRATVARDALAEALARLDRLERRGLPEADDADAWYVELSAIIRRYLEDRFALRAPELTTEEFLARAGDSPLLAGAHRALLRSFLERCDRVKFAAYRPPASESREVIAAARRFLEETRAPSPSGKEAGDAPRA